MDPYQRARLWAPSANPKGLDPVQLAALQKWFATRPESAAPSRDAQPGAFAPVEEPINATVTSRHGGVPPATPATAQEWEEEESW